MATFEDHLGELEEIVRKLEGGDLPLEESLALFERGTELSRLCKVELDRVDARIQVITRGPRAGDERIEDLSMDDFDEGEDTDEV